MRATRGTVTSSTRTSTAATSSRGRGGPSSARSSARLFRFLFHLRRRRLHDDPAHAEALGVDDVDLQVAERGVVAWRDLASQACGDVAADRLLGGLADVDLEAVGEVLDQVVAAHAVAAVAERLDLQALS